MHHKQNLVVFAHGKESGPWGTKITALAEIARHKGFAVESPDYSHTHDFDERVKFLLQLNPTTDGKLVLAGSSMGGYVVAHACKALRPKALFLMAPALYFEGYDKEPENCPEQTVVVHGWRDDIVPLDMAHRFAESRRAALHILDADHPLSNALPMVELLFANLLDQVLS